MEYPIFFFAFLAFLSANPTIKEQTESKTFTDSVKCQHAGMPKAWYSYGTDNTSPPLIDQRREFIIYVDKNCKAQHADSFNVIRFVNNSTGTIILQTQDGSLMAVMQGLSKSGQWCAIQFWQFSHCLRSYHNVGFRPNAAGAFVAQLPNQGNYETKFRFKLIGKDRFYYSDEFTGKIDYCAFKDSAFGGFNQKDTLTPNRSLYTVFQK